MTSVPRSTNKSSRPTRRQRQAWAGASTSAGQKAQKTEREEGGDGEGEEREGKRGRETHHSEKDTRPRADSAEQVGGDGEEADAHAAEHGRDGDVAVELGLHGLGVIARHRELHLLLAEHLRHVAGRGSRNLDPDLGEQGARDEEDDDVEDRVDRVLDDVRLRARQGGAVEAGGGELVRKGGEGEVRDGERIAGMRSEGSAGVAVVDEAATGVSPRTWGGRGSR